MLHGAVRARSERRDQLDDARQGHVAGEDEGRHSEGLERPVEPMNTGTLPQLDIRA